MRLVQLLRFARASIDSKQMDQQPLRFFRDLQTSRMHP